MSTPTTHRTIQAPRGTELSCKSWQAEGAMRMLMNNLDPEVAERPEDLVVYGGRGQAARSWEAFDAIIESLKALEVDETLLVQSGKPVGVIRTHEDAPRVMIANSNLVPHWATQEHFDDLAARGRRLCRLRREAEQLAPQQREQTHVERALTLLQHLFGTSGAFGAPFAGLRPALDRIVYENSRAIAAPRELL